MVSRRSNASKPKADAPKAATPALPSVPALPVPVTSTDDDDYLLLSPLSPSDPAATTDNLESLLNEADDDDDDGGVEVDDLTPAAFYAVRNDKHPTTGKSLYEMIAESLEKDKAAMCNNEYPGSIERKMEGQTSKYFFLGGKKPAEMVLIAEMAPKLEGTALGALGHKTTPLGPNAQARLRFRLSEPKKAPDSLIRVYQNQLALLDALPGEECHEMVRMMENGRRTYTDEILVQSKATGLHDIITVISDIMYAGASSQARNGRKRHEKISSAKTGEDEDVKMGDANEKSDIQVGQRYPKSVMPGSDHPYIDSAPPQVVQFNIRDIDNNLIPTWELDQKLVPGTLVLMKVAPICWTFGMKESSGPVNRRYNLILRSLKVLAQSGEKAEDHSPFAIVPRPPKAEVATTTPAAEPTLKRKAEDIDPDALFTAIASSSPVASPSKKLKKAAA